MTVSALLTAQPAGDGEAGCPGCVVNPVRGRRIVYFGEGEGRVFLEGGT